MQKPWGTLYNIKVNEFHIDYCHIVSHDAIFWEFQIDTKMLQISDALWVKMKCLNSDIIWINKVKLFILQSPGEELDSTGIKLWQQ